jgi:hypothetical protein
MSLLGSQVYANPDTPLWVSTDGGVISGNLTVEGSIYGDNGVFTNEGGGLGGFSVLSVPGGTEVSRIQHLPAPNARTIIQSSDPIFFNQIGTAQGNTLLVTSVYNPATPADVLTVGGAINSVGGGLRVFEGAVPPAPNVEKIAIVNAANQSYIQSDDVLYFSRLGGMAQTSLTLNTAPTPDILSVGGLVSAKALELEDTGAAPTVGSAKLTAGVATVNTDASDVTSYIQLTHTNLNASTAIGTLRVVAKNANNFQVESVDATGVLVAGDDSDFDWLLINPA